MGSEALEGLDLSFVQVGGDSKAKTKQSDVLDMSFLTEQKSESGLKPYDPNAEEVTSSEQPIESDDKSLLQKVGDIFSGADKQTEATKDMEEFYVPDSLLLTNPKKSLKVALGMMTTFDPAGQVKILKENFPKIEFFEDEKGNIIVDGSKEGFGTGLLNAAGLSKRDILQLGFQIAAFSPAAKLASAGNSAIVNGVRVGAGSGATQAAQDLASQATGRTGEVELSNIDKSEVATVGVLGGGIQSLIQKLSGVMPMIRESINKTGITEEIKEVIKNTVIKFGLNADEVTDDMVMEIAKQADNSVNPVQAMAIQGEKEFAIPLTQGQRSLDDAALSLEDSLRSGAKGEKGQAIVRDFEKNTQVPAVNAAKDKVIADISGEATTIPNPSTAGGNLKQAVIEAEQAADDVVRSSYESIGDAALKPESVKSLLNDTKKAIDGLEFVKTPELVPATKGMLDKIESLEAALSVNTGKASNIQLKPIHIKKIEEVRRAFNAFGKAATNSTDLRNITVMKRSFDDFMDNAVKKALFEGDDSALEALKSSRTLFKEYAEKFRANPSRTKGGQTLPDREGSFIEKIISDNPTDEQIINALFGANNLNNVAGKNMAVKFKSILGSDSSAWKSVKQAALQRLIKTTKVNGEDYVSGSKTLSAIDDAMTKNSSLVKEIFSKEEIGLLKRFAMQVKRTQPDIVRSRENPSGTGQVIAKGLADTVKRLTSLLSFTGEPVLVAGAAGTKMAGGLSGKSKAKAAIKPFEKYINNKSATGALIGASVNEASRER